MWNTKGKPIEARRFLPFAAQEILYEFDGPRIFTLVDADGELDLACWSDEDENQNRFVIVPTAPSIIDSLRAGGASVFDALNQPRCWVCDVSHDGQVNQCSRVNFEDIPTDAIPAIGTMLLPAFESESIALEGRVRELDKDRQSFELREIGGPVPSQRFTFNDSLREKVYRAFDDEVRVKLAGRKLPGKPAVIAVAISSIGAENSQNAPL